MREFINNLFAWEIVPHKYDKYVYTTAGAIIGGIAFGMTGSWWEAIKWDICVALSCWGACKFVPVLGEWIASGFGLFKS